MTSVPVLSQALLTYFLLPSSFYTIYFCQALTSRTTLPSVCLQNQAKACEVGWVTDHHQLPREEQDVGRCSCGRLPDNAAARESLQIGSED